MDATRKFCIVLILLAALTGCPDDAIPLGPPPHVVNTVVCIANHGPRTIEYDYDGIHPGVVLPGSQNYWQMQDAGAHWISFLIDGITFPLVSFSADEGYTVTIHVDYPWTITVEPHSDD